MTIVLFCFFKKTFLPLPTLSSLKVIRPAHRHPAVRVWLLPKKKKKKAFLVTQIHILVSVLGPGAAGDICLPKDRMYCIVCQLLGPQYPSIALLMQISLSSVPISYH